MKYCPNRECPSALEHQEPQEYRDEAVACADCGSELRAERPVWPVAPALGPLPWLKIAVTVIVPLLVVGVGSTVAVPRLDHDRLAIWLAEGASAWNFSIFSIGLAPVTTAFVLVELVALVVPRWLRLRHAGPSGRRRLSRAAITLGLLLACVQAVRWTGYAHQLDVLEDDAAVSRLVVVLTLVAGTAVLLLVVDRLDRWALGGGFSLIFTAYMAAAALPWLGAPAGRWPGGSDGAKLIPVALAVAAAATALVLRWRPADSLRLPACGLGPLQGGGIVPAMVAPLLAIGLVPREPARLLTEGLGSTVVVGFTVAVLAVGLGFLFNLPPLVAAFVPDASRRVARAIAYSTAFMLALAGLGWFVHRQLDVSPLLLLYVVPLTATALDAVAEARAVRQHGELVPVWPEHRVYAVDSALAMLEQRGIPSLARSVHQRALWHFFAPFIPIQIMVPAARAEEAGRLLNDHFNAAASAKAA